MAWQPIASAPVNTPILATDGHVIVSCVMTESDMPKRTENGLGYVTEICPDAYGFSGYEWDWHFRTLTHWMPLPELPE